MHFAETPSRRAANETSIKPPEEKTLCPRTKKTMEPHLSDKPSRFRSCGNERMLGMGRALRYKIKENKRSTEHMISNRPVQQHAPPVSDARSARGGESLVHRSTPPPRRMGARIAAMAHHPNDGNHAGTNLQANALLPTHPLIPASAPASMLPSALPLPLGKISPPDVEAPGPLFTLRVSPNSLPFRVSLPFHIAGRQASLRELHLSASPVV